MSDPSAKRYPDDPRFIIEKNIKTEDGETLPGWGVIYRPYGSILGYGMKSENQCRTFIQGAAAGMAEISRMF